MAEHPLLKVIGIAGTLIPVGGALIGLGIYVANLNNQVEVSRAEVQALKGQVAQLQDILQKTQSNIDAGSRGPKGERGMPGPRGPAGPQGPQGERGPAGQGADRDVIRQIVQSMIGSSTSAPADFNVFVDTGGPFDVSKCVITTNLLSKTTFVVKEGMEICAPDGRMLAVISNVHESGIKWKPPTGTVVTSCSAGTVCAFPWLNNQKYLVERTTKNEVETLALLRKI